MEHSDAIRPTRRLAITWLSLLHLWRTSAGLATDDIMGTKVWLDQHLFNMTLKTNVQPDGKRLFKMSESKAIERGLSPWPPQTLPTLCYLGLGQSSVEYLAALAQLFPELQLVLMEVQESQWIKVLYDLLADQKDRVQLGRVEEFAESRGAHRRSCQAISWSADTPPFSFYRYRELFYSAPYVLALFNMHGCTEETKSSEVPKHYCEYLYSAFQSTLCGRVNEDKIADYYGERVYMALVDSVCGESVCMCHAQPDVFVDVHFEHLCREDQEPHFPGQWGQDYFLVNNIFPLTSKLADGIYVDIGASHPFHLSNTAFFDICMGWRGICIEPDPRSAIPLRAMRSCKVINGCAWANQTKMRFLSSGELSAAVEDAGSIGLQSAADDDSQTYFEAQCAPLHDLLAEALPEIVVKVATDGLVQRPVIDLISVDAEGAEVEIFRNFPFEKWYIRTIVIETSRQTATAIDSLLLPAGFVKVAVLGKDAVYVRLSEMHRLSSGTLNLPQKIAWNEPGTDSDVISYHRFQRLFGVDGNLDDEVGDQRLQNETELERQGARFDAWREREANRMKHSVEEASVGNLLSGIKLDVLEQPEVQRAMKDPRVKQALAVLLNDADSFERLVMGDAYLLNTIAILTEAGVVRHPKVQAMVDSMVDQKR